jgi:23S rRNA (cytosine1962-C5)-methyltransferase
MTIEPIETVLENALSFRAALFDERHETAFRLFNGFTEGNPDLVVDLYARTLVIHNYAGKPGHGVAFARAAQKFFLARLPWIQTVVVKIRGSQDPQERRGAIVH